MFGLHYILKAAARCLPAEIDKFSLRNLNCYNLINNNKKYKNWYFLLFIPIISIEKIYWFYKYIYIIVYVYNVVLKI